MDWEERLVELLLNAGLAGVKQGDLVLALRKKATSDLIVERLELLWEQDKVQRFTVPSGKRGGRPSTYWRATEALND